MCGDEESRFAADFVRDRDYGQSRRVSGESRDRWAGPSFDLFLRSINLLYFGFCRVKICLWVSLMFSFFMWGEEVR